MARPKLVASRIRCGALAGKWMLISSGNAPSARAGSGPARRSPSPMTGSSLAISLGRFSELAQVNVAALDLVSRHRKGVVGAARGAGEDELSGRAIVDRAVRQTGPEGRRRAVESARPPELQRARGFHHRSAPLAHRPQVGDLSHPREDA